MSKGGGKWSNGLEFLRIYAMILGGEHSCKSQGRLAAERCDTPDSGSIMSGVPENGANRSLISCREGAK